MKMARFLGILVVIVHALVVVPHGVAHNILHIEMNLWQNVYILVVINLLPIVAAVLIWRRKKLGFLLLLLSMAGSFVFGLFYHFIAAGPDNVSSLGPYPWSNTFLWSAVLLAILEAAGTIVGYLGMKIR